MKSSYFQGGRSVEVTLKALRVFTDVLEYIVARVLARLSKAHGDTFSKEDIKWVLTVPAMWKASARDFMRQAARQVCNRDKIIIFILQVGIMYGTCLASCLRCF